MDRPFTILIPVHNEAENIGPLHDEITRELARRPHRVIVVDDGSTDATAAELARLAPDWTVVRTARAGKSRALQIGIEKVDTDRVVMMDGDLQDDTSAVPALLAEVDAGADCAVGCRARRRDGWLVKRFPSFFFNLFLSLLFGFRFLDINTGLKAFRTDTLRRVHWFENCHRFLPLLVFRLGGRVTHLPTVHRPRVAGTAKFNSPLRFLGGFMQGLLLRLGWNDPAPARLRLWRMLPILVALTIGAGLLHWVRHDWYYPQNDAPAFVPPMLGRATDGQLVSDFQSTARQWDPLGRQTGHGFAHTLVTGSLVPPAHRAVHAALAVQITIGLLLFCALLDRVHPRRSAMISLLHAAAVGTAAMALEKLIGRPEIMVFLVATIGLWLQFSLAAPGRALAAGATLATLAVTSPLSALFAGLAWLGSLAWLPPKERPGMTFLLATLATVIALAGWFAWYPYGVSEWVAGNLRHAAVSVLPESNFNRLDWFIKPTSGLRGLLVAGLAVTAISWGWRERLRLNRPALAAACAVAWLLALWYFAIRQGFAAYNADWMAALAPLGLFPACASISDGGLRRTAWIATALLCVQGSVLLGREQLIRTASWRDGPTPEEIIETIAPLRAETNASTGFISSQFMQLFDDLRGLTRLYRQLENLPPPDKAAFILISQADIRRPEPPDLPGWRLVRDRFQRGPARLGEVDIVPLPRGLQYALYLPEASVSLEALSARLAQPQATGSDNAESSQ